MAIAIDWLHPFYFMLSDGKLSSLYEEALEMISKGLELLAIGGYKQKNYRLCIKYAKIYLNIKPKNVSILRLLFSAYTQEGNDLAAKNVLFSAKKILTIQDFRKVSEEINIRRNHGYKWKRFLNRYSLTTLVLSGVVSYLFMKYFMRLQERDSLFYSIGTGFISFLTSLLFTYSKPK